MNKADISKLPIVTMLLAVFTVAILAEFPIDCSVNHCEITASVQSHHHDMVSKSDGCCSENDSCCCEKSSLALISDLPKIITPTFQYKVKTFNTPLFAHHNSLANTDYIFEQFTPCHTKIPPKIPDIRVMIQSFII
jgi:hypothetical protein